MSGSKPGYTIACSYEEWKRVQKDLEKDPRPFTGTIVISDSNQKPKLTEKVTGRNERYLPRTPSTEVDRKPREAEKKTSSEALRLADLPTAEWTKYEAEIRRKFELVREAAHIRLERRLYRSAASPSVELGKEEQVFPAAPAVTASTSEEKKDVAESVTVQEPVCETPEDNPAVEAPEPGST